MSRTIRMGTMADFQNIKELVGNPDNLMDEWSKEQWVSALERDDVGVFAAEEEGVFHGYAVVRLNKKDPVSLTEKPRALITHLCTMSGEGQLRQMLVQHCLAWARKKGARDFEM